MSNARTKSSVPSNLKGCQIVAGGKAEGRHPRNGSIDRFDRGGVAESTCMFISGTRCAQRIIRSAAVPAAATSAGPGVKGLPRLASLASMAAPERGALRPVPAAAACEMFRLNGKIPAATLNTYTGVLPLFGLDRWSPLRSDHRLPSRIPPDACRYAKQILAIRRRNSR